MLLMFPELDPTFRFDEKTHTYYLKGEKLPSGTQKKKKFIEPFDAEKISMNLAKKQSLTAGQEVEYANSLKQDWSQKRDDGVNTHKHIDFYLKRKQDPHVFENERVEKLYHSWKQFYLNQFPRDLKLSTSELALYSRSHKMAGTMDAIFYREDCKYFSICDWKTDSTFTTDLDRSYSNMLYPFEDQAHNKLNEYSIQLSLYALILESWKVPVRQNFVVHISEEGCTIHECKDFRDRLLNVL